MSRLRLTRDLSLRKNQGGEAPVALRIVRKAVYRGGKACGGQEQACLQVLRKTDAFIQAGRTISEISMFGLSKMQDLYENGSRKGIKPCRGSNADHGIGNANLEIKLYELLLSPR